MKKYLMTGIAALALCVGFTSCSHDLESLSQEEIDLLKAQQVTEKYNQAFIATFGEPAKDQNWGFGPSAGARTRAIIPEDNNYTLTNQTANNPEAPSKPSFRSTSAPVFSATVPDGTPEATSETNLQANQTYQIKTGNLKDPQNQTNLTFYVVEDVTWDAQKQINSNGTNGTTFIVTEGKTLTFNQATANNLRIYMAPGSHLVIGNGVTFKYPNAMLYIGSGCTVTCGATVTFGAEYTVLNDGGTFTANVLNIEEGTLFYNNGTLNANTENAKITVQKSYNNKCAELVNSSSLTASAIDLLAGGGMYNVSGGEVNVQGKTYLYNTNSYWWNDGDYTSEDFELNSIDHVWNTCKLTVHKSDNTGTFKIAGLESHTSFVLDANSSVQTDKMYFGNNADFYMKDKSMLEVLGDCKAYNYNKNHGIIGLGTGTEYSIFKAETVSYNQKGQNLMNYYGNLWVDVEVGNHYQQELLDKSNLNEASDQPTYYFKTGEDRTVLFKFFGDPCPITSNIQPGDCHHGYIVNPPTPFEADLRIMAEDLSATEKSDFDFNDIVFDVQFKKAATETTAGNPARILVRAAGGTLPLRIKIGKDAKSSDKQETGGGWQEIHALWGKSTGIMINTNATQKVSASKGYEADYELNPIDLDYEVWDEEDAQNITIEVLKNGDWVEMEAKVGMPAAKFACSPENHPWAEERQSLSGSTNFDLWVQGKEPYWNWNNFDF